MTNHTQATPTLVPKMYPMDVFGFTGTNVQVQGLSLVTIRMYLWNVNMFFHAKMSVM